MQNSFLFFVAIATDKVVHIIYYEHKLNNINLIPKVNKVNKDYLLTYRLRPKFTDVVRKEVLYESIN